MSLAHGVVEMLERANKSPCTFTEFTYVKVKGKTLSSSTVSKRLKELVPLKFLNEEVSRSDSGRKQVCYSIADRGTKVLELAEEYRKILRGV